MALGDKNKYLLPIRALLLVVVANEGDQSPILSSPQDILQSSITLYGTNLDFVWNKSELLCDYR